MNRFKKVLMVLGIVILVVLASLLIQIIPAVEAFLGWLKQNGLMWIWYGCISGISALCAVIYLKKAK